MNLGPYELNQVIKGDCVEVMTRLPDNSVDSIVTDPPYGLGDDPDIADLLHHWLNDKDYDTGPGFMSRDWDVVPGPAVWRECFRVLKPGGALMAFGGTRTCDLLSIAIRLAGFQRFDQVVWIHSQGFGKGIAIDKGIDSLLGKAGEREVISTKIYGPDGKLRTGGRLQQKEYSSDDYGKYNGNATITAPATEAAARWSGWRSQLKPSHEVILCFWKPREKSFAKNALKWGVAGLNIDGCRIGTEGWQRQDKDVPGGFKTDKYLGEVGRGDYSMPQNGYRESTLGRFPSNVLISHHESCVRVGVKQVRGDKNTPRDRITPSMTFDDNEPGLDPNAHIAPNGYADPDGLETVPDYRCHPDCPVAMLDRQAGVRKSGGSGKVHKSGNGMFIHSNGGGKTRDISDSGSASRFFYTPKAPPREKWFYCQICDDVFPYKERDDHAHGKPKGQRKHQVAHPTVKPLAICNFTLGVLEYLCRLTKTPTGGIVLDPFGGSGTTGLAALANGRPFLLIENDPIYHRIATKRIEQAMKEPKQLELIK